MMERSRGGRLKRDNRLWRWKSLWVSTGAVAFWTSVAGQLVWDAVESVASDSLLMIPDVNLSESSSSIRQCTLQYSQGGHLPKGCAALFQPYAGISLILGIFSLWWNPKLRYKVDGYHGRLIGLREYYRIQLVVLVVRFIAWAGSQDPTFTGHYAHLLPAIHIFTGLFTVIVSLHWLSIASTIFLTCLLTAISPPLVREQLFGSIRSLLSTGMTIRINSLEALNQALLSLRALLLLIPKISTQPPLQAYSAFQLPTFRRNAQLALSRTSRQLHHLTLSTIPMLWTGLHLSNR